MQRYCTYITKQLTHTLVLITVCLTSIVWLTQALRLMDFIVTQGVSAEMFLKLTILMIPSLLMLLLPISTLIAVIFVYNRLRLDSELIVMQAAGISPWRLARPALHLGLLMMVLGYAISLWLLPISYGKFRDMQNFMRNNYVSVLLQEGVFASPVNGLTVFLRERDADGILHGILVHDNRTRGLSVTMMAERGKLIDTENGPRFLLTQGNRQELREGKLSLLNFKEYMLDISAYTNPKGERVVDPDERNVQDLLTLSQDTPAKERKLRSEAHYRLTWPAYSLTLPLLALAVMLAGEFNRRSRWQRNLAAVLATSALMMMAMSWRNAMVTYEIFMPMAYVNLLAPFCAVLWWYFRNSTPKTPPPKGGEK